MDEEWVSEMLFIGFALPGLWLSHGSGKSRNGFLPPLGTCRVTFFSLPLQSIPSGEIPNYSSEAADPNLIKLYSFLGSDSMRLCEDSWPLGQESGFSRLYDPVLSWTQTKKQQTFFSSQFIPCPTFLGPSGNAPLNPWPIHAYSARAWAPRAGSKFRFYFTFIPERYRIIC